MNININVDIDNDLWKMIKKNYENENYSGAILDAIHLLTETIRNKSGLEGDGVKLIQTAFSVKNPRIKINNLQTESEINIQKGTQELLVGFYTAIRNPRSHDRIDDKKSYADAIIIFINHIIGIIDQSKFKFQIDEFLKYVFDKNYVESDEYSKLLVEKIPERQRVNVVIKVMSKRNMEYIFNLKSFIKSLFDKLKKDEVDRIYKVISEELDFANSVSDISEILIMFPGAYWGCIEKRAKLRAEKILFEEVIKENINSRGVIIGEYITYDHMLCFDNINSWMDMLVSKLEKEALDKHYVYRHFWDDIHLLNKENINCLLKTYIINGLSKQDKNVMQAVENKIKDDKEHPWWKVFEKELENYTDIKKYSIFTN
ncbi:TIGR02391 family protein [Clostridium ihumii]|uniref:TIGR02391 family protein n=1 Tax=Clostridium ihumii TaxID=1470356 RepID=UPI0005500D57|nr:TIGR02391 family protein [Clostridium ihumii]